jgi:hypothetical protein
MPNRFRADLNRTTQVEEMVKFPWKADEQYYTPSHLYWTAGAQQSYHRFVATCFVLELVGWFQLQESDIQHRQAMSCQVVPIGEDMNPTQNPFFPSHGESGVPVGTAIPNEACLPFPKHA